MINNSEIENFLKTKNMKLLEAEVSESFGNWYEIWGSDILEFIFRRDRGQETVDVRRKGASNFGYDLDLLRELMIRRGEIQEKEEIRDISSLCEFIMKYYDQIEDLFQTDRYPKTQKEMKYLEYESCKKMFPNNWPPMERESFLLDQLEKIKSIILKIMANLLRYFKSLTEK